MKSTNGPPVSPFTTSPFTHPFSGSNGDSPPFQEYQYAELTSPWFVIPNADTQASDGLLENPPAHQGYNDQAPEPFVATQQPMYRQLNTHGSSAMCSPDQQASGTFLPIMWAPRTPATNATLGLPYHDAPDTRYVVGDTVPVHTAMPYSYVGNNGPPVDYPPHGEVQGYPAEVYQTCGVGTFNMQPHGGHCEALSQDGTPTYSSTAPQYSHKPSEASSFVSDTVAVAPLAFVQERPQKTAKKRNSTKGVKRGHKAILEATIEKSPEVAPKVPAAVAPKRAKRQFCKTGPEITSSAPTGVPTPANIGRKHQAQNGEGRGNTPDRSQRQKATTDGHMPTTEVVPEADIGNLQLLEQKLQYLEQENQSLSKCADKLKKDVQRLEDKNSTLSRQQTELRRDVVDVNCKMLELVSRDNGISQKDVTVVAEVKTAQKMETSKVFRRPSASSVATSTTAVSSRHNSAAETVYSAQEDGWEYSPRKGSRAMIPPAETHIFQARS